MLNMANKIPHVRITGRLILLGLMFVGVPFVPFMTFIIVHPRLLHSSPNCPNSPASVGIKKEIDTSQANAGISFEATAKSRFLGK